MDDLYRAGGLAPIFKELAPLLNLDCLTVTGRTLGEEIERRRDRLQSVGDSPKMRGYRRLFHEQVNQAGQGCDFAFLASVETTRKTP